jgi:hypothetical protein
MDEKNRKEVSGLVYKLAVANKSFITEVFDEELTEDLIRDTEYLEI